MDRNLCTIYVVRHGETEWNVKKLLQGQLDIPLNETGIRQATKLKEKLKHVQFDIIFSSDLERAVKTVDPIAIEHDLITQTTHILRERDFGRLAGAPVSALNKFKEEFNSLSKEERFRYKYYPEIESDEETVSRVITFLREVAVTYPGKTILIATHRGVMYSLLIHLGYMNYYQNSKRPIKNTAYIKLETDGVDFFVKETHGIIVAS